jgi:anti-sigma regulatory factor (Ser/Thr protein kinase)
MDVEVCFPATMVGLTIAMATIDQFHAARNLHGDEIACIRIVAEELISNTIKYGYGAECDRPIRLRLSADPIITLTYDDEAAPFDPTAWRTNEAPGTRGRELREGRAGIELVLGLSSTALYQRRPEGNRLVLTFAPRP